MSRELFTKFIQQSFGTVICAVLLSVCLLTMSGCTRTISGKQTRAAEKDNRENSVKTVKDFAGKWHKTEGGRVDYAVYAENLGNFESYEITEDGRVKFETLNAARNFDCVVEVSTRTPGVINLSAGSPELNIDLYNGTVRQTNTCSPDKNSTASTTPRSTNYQWRMSETEDGATELCLTKSDGQTACYRRAE